MALQKAMPMPMISRRLRVSARRDIGTPRNAYADTNAPPMRRLASMAFTLKSCLIDSMRSEMTPRSTVATSRPRVRMMRAYQARAGLGQGAAPADGSVMMAASYPQSGGRIRIGDIPDFQPTGAVGNRECPHFRLRSQSTFVSALVESLGRKTGVMRRRGAGNAAGGNVADQQQTITAPPGETPVPAPGKAWYAIGVFAVVLMLNFLDRGIVGLLVPQLKQDMGLSDTQ